MSIGHPAQSPESRDIERGDVALEMNGVRLDVRVTRTGRIEKTFAKANTLRAERWLTLRRVVPEK